MQEQEITLKNTKAEIFDALTRVLERAEQAEKRRLNPEKAEKEQNEKRAVASAKQAVEQNVFSQELTEKFNDLQAAIQAEEERLQELYGVGREVQKLALVIEAGRERIAEIEAEKREKEEALTKSTETLTTEFQQKQTALQAEHNAVLEKRKIERARESEEYNYNLERARERENNAWEDEKAAREVELQRREAVADELLADAESKAGYIQSLEEQAKNIPQQIAAEKEAVTAAVTETLQREYGHQAEMAEMERKNTVDRLEDKITYLEKELESAGKTVVSLQGKLDKAYAEIRDLATKTVEATGSLKIIGNPEKSSG